MLKWWEVVSFRFLAHIWILRVGAISTKATVEPLGWGAVEERATLMTLICPDRSSPKYLRAMNSISASAARKQGGHFRPWATMISGPCVVEQERRGLGTCGGEGGELGTAAVGISPSSRSRCWAGWGSGMGASGGIVAASTIGPYEQGRGWASQQEL